MTAASNRERFTFDTLGRVTLLPAADAPTPEHGDITLGYYDDDLPLAITQGQTATTLTLDVLARRHTMTSVTGTGSTAVTTTVRNHYDDTSDNPAWTTTATSTGGGAPGPVQTLRFTGGIDTDLTAVITGDGEATLNLNNPGGHLAATVSIPADQNTGTAATGIDSWNDYTEYGAPKHTTTPAGSPATTSAGGYGWYAEKQRHTSAATAELTLMGVRLYNRVRGLFTATDPIPGGNTNTYTHPTDPNTFQDLDGKRGWCRCMGMRGKGGGGVPIPLKKGGVQQPIKNTGKSYPSRKAAENAAKSDAAKITKGRQVGKFRRACKAGDHCHVDIFHLPPGKTLPKKRSAQTKYLRSTVHYRDPAKRPI